MEFAGAVLFGSTVTKTISSGVVTIGAATFAAPVSYMLGMLAVLFGCTVWMAVATKFGLPVSSTHSVVGALIGLGLVSGWGINYGAVQRIVASWFLSPLIGGVISTLLYKVISVAIVDAKRPAQATRRFLPVLAGGASFVLTMFLLGKGVRFAQALTPDRVFYIALGVAFACSGVAGALATAIHSRQYIARKFGINGDAALSGADAMVWRGDDPAVGFGAGRTGHLHRAGVVRKASDGDGWQENHKAQADDGVCSGAEHGTDGAGGVGIGTASVYDSYAHRVYRGDRLVEWGLKGGEQEHAGEYCGLLGRDVAVLSVGYCGVLRSSSAVPAGGSGASVKRAVVADPPAIAANSATLSALTFVNGPMSTTEARWSSALCRLAESCGAGGEGVSMRAGATRDGRRVGRRLRGREKEVTWDRGKMDVGGRLGAKAMRAILDGGGDCDDDGRGRGRRLGGISIWLVR
ncbi:Phosphate transporter [Gracilaria domingensis]|nr:Phosphate transporter [Gracilaria domingensis]